MYPATTGRTIPSGWSMVNSPEKYGQSTYGTGHYARTRARAATHCAAQHSGVDVLTAAALVRARAAQPSSRSPYPLVASLHNCSTL
eukprot:6214824-Pleurochrysis_carterae.AAC.2